MSSVAWMQRERKAMHHWHYATWKVPKIFPTIPSQSRAPTPSLGGSYEGLLRYINRQLIHLWGELSLSFIGTVAYSRQV